MLTTGMMTTTILPAASTTTLAIGPLAVLVFAGLAFTAAVLIAGVVAELRRGRPAITPTVRLTAALPHTA